MQPKLDAGVTQKPGHEHYAERNSICGQAGGLGPGYGNISKTLDGQQMTSLSCPKAPVL